MVGRRERRRLASRWFETHEKIYVKLVSNECHNCSDYFHFFFQFYLTYLQFSYFKFSSYDDGAAFFLVPHFLFTNHLRCNACNFQKQLFPLLILHRRNNMHKRTNEWINGWNSCRNWIRLKICNNLKKIV